MLGDKHSILNVAADRWTTEHYGDAPRQVFHERRKVDLMVALGDTDDLCMTAPVLLVEHENAHDVEIETWNLACWRVPLRVLVFYSDDTDREDKLNRMRVVLRRLDSASAMNGEFVLISAPWTFGTGLTWTAWEWRNGEFQLLSDVQY